MSATDSILSGQLRHFRSSQRRLLPGSDSGADSAPSSKDSSPQLSATEQPEAALGNGSLHAALPHLVLSPASSPSEQLLSSTASTSASSAASQPANESSTPLSSPLSLQPSSRSLPSTPTKAFATILFPPSAAAASPHASPSSASASSPTSAQSAYADQAAAALQTKMHAEPRYPSVGRISPQKPDAAAAGSAKAAAAAAAAEQCIETAAAAEDGRAEMRKAEDAEEPLSRPEVPDSSRSLPLVSPPPSEAAPPPFKRSFSTSSTRPSASRGIPLRSLAATSTILSPLTSPLRTPSPKLASTSPLSLSSAPASSAAHSPSPPAPASAPSQQRPFPSFDGLTPQTTIRTLKPLLTLEATPQHSTPPSSASSASSGSGSLSASSASSTPLSTATTLTPASAMRVLFTGQSGVGSGQPQPTTRRLSGRQSRDSSPTVSPVLPSHSPPPSAPLPPGAISTHSRHFSLTSPTNSPPVDDDGSNPPPPLHRAATSDPRRHGSTSSSASVSDFFAVPSPTPGEEILNGEESDSDEEDAEADASPLPAAAPAPIAGLFFHTVLSHLPFSPSAAFLQHLETSYAVLITLSLFYALFVDPIRLALLPAAADRVLAVLLLLIFFLLLAEFAFFLHSNPSYCGSLEAALDCCALLSLLPQVAAMWYEMELSRIESALMMMMRAGVMVRLVGVLRLIPITSFFSSSRLQELQRRWKRWQRRQRLRYWQRHDKQQDGRINLLRTDDADDAEAAEPPPAKEEESSGSTDGLSSALYPSHASRIGQLLSDYTAHRVVLGVLFVLLLYNYFHPHRLHTVHPYAVHHLDSMLEGSMNSSTSTIERTVQDYTHKYRQDLLSLTFDNVTLLNQSELFSRLRPHERQHIVTRHFDCWVNVRPWSQQFALFDFWSLLLVLLLLPVLLCLIYDDVHAVISPIERMRKFVTNLATDPMSEISASDQTLSSSLASLLPSISASAGLQSLSSPSSAARSSSPSSSSLCSSSRSASSGSFSLDSFFVELTLQRLAILLQLVFGSAGANIIANNIRGDYLEVVTPGRKVYAIFAFMGVEGWDGMMETLQVEMSELMNATAELVHSVCVLFGGEVNKNIGNAFLLVWKLEAAEAASRAEDREEDRAAAGGAAKRDRNSGSVADLLQRRQTHHADERTHPLRPSTSFPRSLSKELPPPHDDLSVPPPSSSSSMLVPPPPASRRTVSHVPVAPRPPQLLRRRRAAVQRVEELREERKELPSPDDVDSPPAPVHCDEVAKQAALAEGRRNSLLSGILSLSRRDLGSIFTRSSLNLFGVGAEAAAAAAEDRSRKQHDGKMEEIKEKGRSESEREEKAPAAAAGLTAAAEGPELSRALSADLQSSMSPPLSDRSQTLGAHHHVHSSHASSGSYYSRTHPTPPMPQPSARKHHGWKLNASNHRLAEQALCSFLLTLLQLSTSPSLLKWRQHPLLISHHLSLQFGIGLHVGWAIEGAIGSSHKIDASYLSPNVNLSSRLSVLCHHYHLPLLFSSAFHSLLGVEVQKRCRKVDVVSVKGSRKPIGIYTFDIDFGDVTEMERGRREEREREGAAAGPQPDDRERERAAAAAGGGIAHHESFDERMRRKQVKEIEEIMRQLKRASRRRQRQQTDDAGGEQQHSSPSASSDDEEDAGGERATDGRRRSHRRASAPEVPSGAGLHRSSSSSSLSAHSPLLPSLPHLLSSLQSHLPPPFIPLYNAACSCYIDGDWRSAGRLLVRVLNMRSGDGPSQLLLKVMAKEGFRAPTGWKGYRALTKK